MCRTLWVVCCERLLHSLRSSTHLPCWMVQLRGHKVCIVEKRRVEGRNQEWNVSRHELQVRDTMPPVMFVTF